MRIAIAGGTGLVGTHVARLAEAAGHDVLVLSRSTGTDLMAQGQMLDLTGIDVLIDVSGPPAGSKPVRFFETTTEVLLRAEARAGVTHHVALSIVGAAASPYGYYAGKAAQEKKVAAGGVPWTVLRATQFFEFALQTGVPLGPWLLVPRMRSRPLAAETVAARLVELAGEPPGGNAPDLAGPDEMYMGEVARAVFAAQRQKTRVIELPLPGRFGRSLRNGDILPGTEAQIAGPGLAEWLR